MSIPQNKKLSTPDIPASDVVFCVSATTRINASASLVFTTLRNTETWKDWNRFVPRVTITHQPPEEDAATMAETEEIVRNTSIAGSIDSDITEGIGHGSPNNNNNKRPPTPEERKSISSAPVVRHRLPSNASRNSTESTSNDPNADSIKATAAAAAAATTNGGPSTPQNPKDTTNTQSTSNNFNFNPDGQPPSSPTSSMPAQRKGSLAVASTSVGPSQGQPRRLSILTMYGEPSVRVNQGTKLTFHVRMKLPTTATTSETYMIVTEISRPVDDDDDDNNYQFNNNNNNNKSFPGTLQPNKTKPKSNSTGIYRIVWGMNSQYDPPKSFPKFLLHTQRVHEIRPITTGDGRNDRQCEYSSWECQKGMLAKRVNKKYGKYLQERFDEWNLGIKEFCESMGGAVERRDFSISK